jgi:hypothetical protein
VQVHVRGVAAFFSPDWPFRTKYLPLFMVELEPCRCPPVQIVALSLRKKARLLTAAAVDVICRIIGWTLDDITCVIGQSHLWHVLNQPALSITFLLLPVLVSIAHPILLSSPLNC